MKFSFEALTTATPEAVWQHYADVNNWFGWEDDLIAIHLDGPFEKGISGEMTLTGMPPMSFTLVEVTKNRSFCDETKIPGLGSLFFNHELTGTEQGTIIKHSVEFISLETSDSQEQLGFLTQVFSDVPESIFALAKVATSN